MNTATPVGARKRALVYDNTDYLLIAIVMGLMAHFSGRYGAQGVSGVHQAGL